MESYKLTESEYRLAVIIWEHEPLSSRELVSLCDQILGWKKSTTYTFLKNLCENGIMRNDNSIVSSLIRREQVQKAESERFINRTFDGSLPKFIAAFFGDKKLSDKEADELKKLIDSHRQEGDI